MQRITNSMGTERKALYAALECALVEIDFFAALAAGVCFFEFV
jgi:hypothetical protein